MKNILMKLKLNRKITKLQKQIKINEKNILVMLNKLEKLDQNEGKIIK